VVTIRWSVGAYQFTLRIEFYNYDYEGVGTIDVPGYRGPDRSYTYTTFRDLHVAVDTKAFKFGDMYDHYPYPVRGKGVNIDEARRLLLEFKAVLAVAHHPASDYSYEWWNTHWHEVVAEVYRDIRKNMTIQKQRRASDVARRRVTRSAVTAAINWSGDGIRI
jgi:hypothetical protein